MCPDPNRHRSRTVLVLLSAHGTRGGLQAVRMGPCPPAWTHSGPHTPRPLPGLPGVLISGVSECILRSIHASYSDSTCRILMPDTISETRCDRHRVCRCVCAESGCLMRTLNGPPPRLRASVDASAPPEDLTDTVSVPPRPGRRAGRVGRGCVSHSTVCVMSPLTVAFLTVALRNSKLNSSVSVSNANGSVMGSSAGRQ